MKIRLKKLSPAQKFYATTAVITVVCGTLIVREKYNLKIEEARSAGITDWIVEMNGRDLVVCAFPKEIADRVFASF